MNDEEIKKLIKNEAEKAGNIIGISIIIAALCIVVVGVCWASAWFLVSVK